MSATRPTWLKNVLRQRPCSESRSKKTGLNVKSEKRQNSKSGKGWRKKLEENRKKRNSGAGRNNARGIWHIV